MKESRLESQQRTVQKLWQAGEEGSGLWMDREEACQMKRMMKNLMEDCEDARRMARKELLQKASCACGSSFHGSAVKKFDSLNFQTVKS